MDNNAKKVFDILATGLSVQYNYFDGPTKLFLNLYLSQFLDSKLFLCILFKSTF